jgi:hypothetical protein
MNPSRTGAIHLLITAVTVASSLLAQQPKPSAPKPVQAQSTSTISSATTADGWQTIDIRNVAYEVTNTGVPGRPADQRLLLRKTTHSKETVGDIDVEATVTLDAWRFGDDPRGKPLYTLNATGTDGHTLDTALFIASRGVEEVDWWSVYKLGNGQHFFDTYVPLLNFSISRETVAERYVGLEVPPDDTKDARLKQPNVIAVLTYASQDRVIREALLTSDDRQQAALLRSFADVTRTLALQEGKTSRALKLSFSQNYPSPANTAEVLIPVAGDDLDLAHAQLPARLHVAVWKR